MHPNSAEVKISLWNSAHSPVVPFLLTCKKLEPLACLYPKLALFIHSQATKEESNLSNRFYHVESIVMKPKLQLTEFELSNQLINYLTFV